MKAIVVFIFGLTTSVLAANVDRRMRRDLSVQWLWETDNHAPGDNNEQPQVTEIEKLVNRTPKTRCSLVGAWYNQLGSEMIINGTSDNGVMYGEYRTAVERREGSAGDSYSRVVVNTSPDGVHPTFGMTVVWRNGLSVASWAGQCHQSGGEEKLTTTWILTSKVDSFDDHWMANRIGQDTFTRYEVKDGPRKADNTHTPRDFARRREMEEQSDL